MLSFDVIANEFKSDLESLGYSYSSCHMLSLCVNEFLDFCREKEIKNIKKITHHVIDDYHHYLQQRPNRRRSGGLSEMMISHHFYAVRRLFDYLEKTGTITFNPASIVHYPRPHYRQREILSVSQIRILYDCCLNYFEKAVLSVFYGCGLRRSEAVKLNKKDVNLKTGLLYVREGKGKKRRVVPMTKQIIANLKKYNQKERAKSSTYESFFNNTKGNKISGDYFNIVLKRLIERAVKQGLLGQEVLEKQICLHSLRHSIATHLLENGLSMEYVRDFLGHSHLESTQRYTHVNKNKLLEI
jgi:integrase/recombinase XerD